LAWIVGFESLLVIFPAACGAFQATVPKGPLSEAANFTSRRAEQQWSRMQGVKMVRAGYPATEVATLFGVSTRAVYKSLAICQTALLHKFNKHWHLRRLKSEGRYRSTFSQEVTLQ